MTKRTRRRTSIRSRKTRRRRSSRSSRTTTTRRRKRGWEGGQIIRKKSLLFKIIPFLLLRVRIQNRIRTPKSDLDPVKSRPDPQHCSQDTIVPSRVRNHKSFISLNPSVNSWYIKIWIRGGFTTKHERLAPGQRSLITNTGMDPVWKLATVPTGVW